MLESLENSRISRKHYPELMVLLSWHWLFFGQSQMERMVLWGSGAQEKDTERVGTKLKSHSSDWVQVSKSWWCHVALWPHEEFLKKKLRFGDTHKVSYGWSLEKKVWFETSLVWWSHPLNRALAFTPSGLALYCIDQRLPIWKEYKNKQRAPGEHQSLR